MNFKTILITTILLALAITLIVGWNPLKAAITVLNIQRDTLTNGLVGYWTFDGPDINWATGKVSDKSGQGLDGTVSGMATTTDPRPGVVGQALNFDLDNNFVDLPDVNFGSTFTISVWMKSSNSNGTIKNLITAGNTASPNEQIGLSYDHNASGFDDWIRFLVKTSSTDSFWLFSTSTVVTDNTWHHIVGTRNSDDFALYIDGVSVGSGTKAGLGTQYDNFEFPDIGRWVGASSYNDGLIDELRIYNRALSVKEIKELHRRGAPERRPRASTNPRTDLIPNGLVGYWTFDGPDITWSTSASSTATDRSGNSHTGEVKLGIVPVSGAMGQGLKFDGVDDYVAVDSTDALKFLDDTITFAAWIKPTSIAAGNRSIFVKMFSQNDQIQYGFFLATDEPSFYYTSASNVQHQYTSDAANLRADNWYHVAFTYTYGTGSSAKTYVNGVEFSGTWTSGTGNNIARTNIRELWIGRMEHSGFPNLFSGVIDEVRIYDRILSAKEIEELYRSGKR